MDRSEAGLRDRPEHDWHTEAVETLLRSETFANPHARALLIWLVEAALAERGPLADTLYESAPSSHHRPPTTALLECVELVRRCDRRPRGLRTLAATLRLLEPDSGPAQRVAELAEERKAAPPAGGMRRPTLPDALSAPPDRDERKDFFISYAAADQRWAVWVAWELESAGYRVLVQEWDFVPGSNWQLGMERGMSECERVLAVLSPAYVESVYGRLEWQVALGSDPTGFTRRLVPVRVTPCHPSGLLAALVFIDLVGLTVEQARTRLLHGMDSVRAGRSKPLGPPRYPASDHEKGEA
ncbi:toll/interleukin-1 receptor domain-containing protein [Streptomyces guryensis]|uniref:Toll/interleukin-1 receptor domain-containing protein n=1 Tax=Streptomyces guryensis TaxID=2886947 RepID=A0A9Q3Z6V0_9ACTN|nr:toll/interleukin-1 receptor domain-containing protein [Streptomyces guryensis]MCD9875639.1 toll/interleukin-1 receptor domain-containing protein [Streptomyces guryensis]